MGKATITQEMIASLWTAAAALVEECAEPCWGLAQGLSQLAEQVALEAGVEIDPSGLIFEYCCPGCGKYGGEHAAWCIHAFERSAAEPEARQPSSHDLPLHYFGCCPRCHQEGRMIHVGRVEWCICEEHKIAWWIGSNLFSGWRDLTEEEHEANRALIERCEIIEPPVCTCEQEPELCCTYPSACFNCDQVRTTHPDLCGRFLEDNPPWGPVNEDDRIDRIAGALLDGIDLGAGN